MIQEPMNVFAFSGVILKFLAKSVSFCKLVDFFEAYEKSTKKTGYIPGMRQEPMHTIPE